MINILKKKEISTVLENLTSSTKPSFGIMSPQHMVEHLAEVVKFSNGKRKSDLMRSTETSIRWKQVLIYTDYEMQPGVRAPFIPENALPDLQYLNLEEAINILSDELTEFEKYFENQPDLEVMHPALGLLNYKEWVIFHNKHFAHHFRQFGLL